MAPVRRLLRGRPASTAPTCSSARFNYTASASPAGANLGFFADKKLDDLIDKAASTLDEKARNAIYVDAQKEVNEQAPHVLLYTKQDLFATRASVKGTWVIPGGLIVVKDAKKQ